MKAHEWDTTDDLDALFAAIKGRASDRKMLLFACGCCRLAEGSGFPLGFLAHEFETRADRPMSSEEKFSLLSAAFQVAVGDPKPMLLRLLGGSDQNPWQLAQRVASLLRHFQALQHRPADAPADKPHPEPSPHSSEQAATLRELLGNPFRPVAFDPGWRTETVVVLAASIEEENAWDRMPILADALQDAGCEVPEVLAHCRDAAPVHRRGCWVIDLILGRP